MRVAFVGDDRWLSAGLALVCSARPWEYVSRPDVTEDLAETADVVVLDGAGGPAASHRAAELAAEGNVVVIIADGPMRAHLLAVGEIDGVTVVERGDGPEAVQRLLDEIAPVIAGEALGPERGETARLSEQEKRVLARTAEGATAFQVAEELGISSGTVAAYLRRIRKKYAMAGRAAPRKLDLFHRAVEDGIIAVRPQRSNDAER